MKNTCCTHAPLFFAGENLKDRLVRVKKSKHPAWYIACVVASKSLPKNLLLSLARFSDDLASTLFASEHTSMHAELRRLFSVSR